MIASESPLDALRSILDDASRLPDTVHLSALPFISIDNVFEDFHPNIFKWPYFSLRKDGASVPPGAVTESRRVVGQRRDGFLQQEKWDRYLESGYVSILHEPHRWLAPIREYVSRNSWDLSSCGSALILNRRSTSDTFSVSEGSVLIDIVLSVEDASRRVTARVFGEGTHLIARSNSQVSWQITLRRQLSSDYLHEVRSRAREWLFSQPSFLSLDANAREALALTALEEAGLHQ